MVRILMANSGDLIGQWQASPNMVGNMAIAVKDVMVIGTYGRGGMWIWSFREDEPGFVQSNKSPETADGLRLAKWLPNQQRQSSWVSSIAFTVNGKEAASRSLWDKFVLVWDTATGTFLRQLDINKAADRVMAWAVAISSSVDWILRRDRGGIWQRRWICQTCGVCPVNKLLWGIQDSKQ
jgi:WD40 repeat protein